MLIGMNAFPWHAMSLNFLSDFHLLDDLDSERSRKCNFSSNSMSMSGEETVNLSGNFEEVVLQLRKEVPLEMVVTVFQKLVSVYNSHTRQ